jgi:multiple sugar transport system ATP-binding protein
VEVQHEPGKGFLPVEAHIIEPLGSYDIVDFRVGGQILRARTRAGHVTRAGERVHARLDPTQAHFFDTASGQSLGVRL